MTALLITNLVLNLLLVVGCLLFIRRTDTLINLFRHQAATHREQQASVYPGMVPNPPPTSDATVSRVTQHLLRVAQSEGRSMTRAEAEGHAKSLLAH